MDRLLAYQNAGIEPPPVYLAARPDGPKDLLDEPMQLSLADKAHLGMPLEHAEDYHHLTSAHQDDHLQWELRMALERIHTNAGHSQPIGGVEARETKPFEGMDPVSSALLMELATTVMPEKPDTVTYETRYSPSQRKLAIQRWMAKRARRHLTSQTKYRKMKDVAVSKARCKGGKFIKKSERERMEREEREAAAAAASCTTDAVAVKMEQVVEIPQVVQPIGMEAKKLSWAGDSAWQTAYNFYARSEE